jgi:hypothetical protein
VSAQTVQSRGRSANIFINYRREDSSGHAGRLFDALSSRFPGRLFMDIDTLQPGVDFVDAIEQAVASCDVLLVVIGREWLTVENAAGKRRLDDGGDFVRLELESALARNIRIIPVLVQDAPMPGADELPPSIARLARRNAIELSDARWAYDVHRLADTLQQILGEADAPAPPPTPPATDDGAARRRVALLSLGALAAIAAVALAVWLWPTSHPAKPIPAPPSVAQETAAAADLHPPDGAGGKAGPAIPATQAASQVSTAGSQTIVPPVGPATGKGAAATAPDAMGTDRPPDQPAVRPTPRRAAPRLGSWGAKAKPPVADEPSEAAKRSKSVDVPAPQVTITAPAAGEKVGATVQVQGSVEGLGEQRIFLCIKQPDGRYYPRGEIFPKDGGQWTIQLRSSKEKSFDVLVVAARSKEASQALSDQTSRDNGLSPLPAGATIAGVPVPVQRQRTLFGLD